VLSLVASDACNHIIPLAAAIVGTEREETWSYFLRLCVRHMPRLDAEDMVLMSDRCKGLDNAVAATCPRAHHVFCVVHLTRNVAVHCGAEAAGDVKPLIYTAVTTPRRESFLGAMEEIRKKSEAAYTYLNKIPPESWTQAASSRPHFRVATSNAAESLNAVLEEARHRGAPDGSDQVAYLDVRQIW